MKNTKKILVLIFMVIVNVWSIFGHESNFDLSDINDDENTDDKFFDELQDDVEAEDLVKWMSTKAIKNKDPLRWGSITRRRRRSKGRCSSPLKSKTCIVKNNGCGAGGAEIIPFSLREEFTPSCNKHDVCYSCGQYYGWSQKECDKRFHEDMKKACRCKVSTLGKPKCYLYANIFYNVVKGLGKRFFEENSPNWCTNICVIPYGNPDVEA